MLSGIGFFFVVFGLLVVIYPELLAYMIGFFFLFLGLNLILIRYIGLRKASDAAWKFGDYEITRKK